VSTNVEKIFWISVPTMIARKKWKILVSRHLFAPPTCASQTTRRAAFNLIDEIDIPETQMCIVAYQKENAALIGLNQQRDEAYVQAQALKEQEQAECRERQLCAEELRHARRSAAREGEQRTLIDHLESSDADATVVRVAAGLSVLEYLECLSPLKFGSCFFKTCMKIRKSRKLR
jgi:hypothetical protein